MRLSTGNQLKDKVCKITEVTTKKSIAIAMMVLLAAFCVACGGNQSAPQLSPVPTSVEPVAPVTETSAPQSVEPEPAPKETELIVSAAASLTDITKELAEAYKRIEPNVTLTFTYGSSGSLQTQIEEGAPTDIFISAAKKQMNALTEKGIIHGSSQDLLINRITLVVPADSTAGIESFEDCGTDKVKIISFGDPATTPAGQYGQEIFTGLGIVDAVNEKANLASDVRQVLTWVEMSAVDCGIVFMTDALTTDLVKVVAVAPDGSHTPAIYPVGVIEASANKEESQKFIDFLYTDEAKALFEKSGFSMAK